MNTTPRDYAAEILAARKTVQDPQYSFDAPEVEAAAKLSYRLDDEAETAGVRVDFTALDEQARAFHHPAGSSARHLATCDR